MHLRSMRMDFVPLLKWKYNAILHESTANQQAILQGIVFLNGATEYGKKHELERVNSYEDYREQLPIIRYSDMETDVERMTKGEANILSSEEPMAFSRTSGTTSSSKFIPITKSFLHANHYYASKLILYNLKTNYNFPSYIIGKNLSLSGYFYEDYNVSPCIDISALMVARMPFFFRFFNFPPPNEIFYAWDAKLKYILDNWQALEKIRMISGVPTWVLSLFNSVEQHTGKKVTEVFKSLQLYIHGGVNFAPYRDTFTNLFEGKVKFLETYNATEGFFGIQDKEEDHSLLLISNGDIFYEFIPYSYRTGAKEEQIIPLWKVEKDTDYLIVISSPNGLYRYVIGDVVRFKSIAPYKFTIVGREKEYINAFGEDLYLDHIFRAFKELKTITPFEVEDFFVVPQYITDKSKGCHEWYIEFRIPPADLETFSTDLDRLIQNNNNNYTQKRDHNRALNPLQIISMPKGIIRDYLSRKGRIGGQIKLKKLHNDRDILSEFPHLKKL